MLSNALSISRQAHLGVLRPPRELGPAGGGALDNDAEHRVHGDGLLALRRARRAAARRRGNIGAVYAALRPQTGAE